MRVTSTPLIVLEKLPLTLHQVFDGDSATSTGNVRLTYRLDTPERREQLTTLVYEHLSRALGALNEARVYHHDLSWGNILFDVLKPGEDVIMPSVGFLTLKVIDFGLATPYAVNTTKKPKPVPPGTCYFSPLDYFTENVVNKHRRRSDWDRFRALQVIMSVAANPWPRRPWPAVEGHRCFMLRNKEMHRSTQSMGRSWRTQVDGCRGGWMSWYALWAFHASGARRFCESLRSFIVDFPKLARTIDRNWSPKLSCT
jgi:hypothetical protein